MGCSCEHKGDPSAMGDAPRPVTGMAAEPLLAVYEDDASENPTVFGCGSPKCDPLISGHPSTLRIERYRGGTLISGTDTELPTSLQHAYAHGNQVASPACLPWVRVQRDPERFSGCLTAARKLGKITSAKQVFDLFHVHAVKEDQEVFYVLLLDTQLQVRGVGEISRGARDRVQVPIPDVLRLPLLEGAMGFIVVHNHPSGNVTPSEADKEITKAIAKAAAQIEVPLFDHVIIGPKRYYSFYDHKQL